MRTAARISQRSRRAIARAAPAALVLAAAWAGSGCAARRELVVTSEPPGALVRVGDELIGETPVTIPFQHYSAVRVTLYSEGHKTYSKLIDLKAPWYGYPVVDIVSELFPWRDRHLLRVDLVPLSTHIPAPEIDAVLERAESLRRAGPEGPVGTLGESAPDGDETPDTEDARP